MSDTHYNSADGDSIQYRPIFRQMPEGSGFDEAGRLIPVLDPSALPENEQAEVRRETLAIVLRFVDRGGPKRTWQFLAVLGYLIGRSDCRSQTALARKLKMSAGRVSQLIAEIRRENPGLALIQRRQRAKN